MNWKSTQWHRVAGPLRPCADVPLNSTQLLSTLYINLLLCSNEKIHWMQTGRKMQQINPPCIVHIIKLLQMKRSKFQFSYFNCHAALCHFFLVHKFTFVLIWEIWLKANWKEQIIYTWISQIITLNTCANKAHHVSSLTWILVQHDWLMPKLTMQMAK